MKNIAYILVISLLLLNVGCQQTSDNTHQGYGTESRGIDDDNRNGGRVVTDDQSGMEGITNGGAMNNTVSAGDTIHTPGAVGEMPAASATEKVQAEVGNSHNTGEEIHSKSRTTENKVIKLKNP